MKKQKINPSIHNTFDKLYKVYGVDYRTFKAWIEPISDEIKCDDPDRHKLFIREVNTITGYLGLPYPEADEKDFSRIDFTKHNTIKALSTLYNIDRRTFHRRIIPIQKDLRSNNTESRTKLFPNEVREIINFLGAPPKPKPRKNNKSEKNASPVSSTKKDKKDNKNNQGLIPWLFDKMWKKN